MRIGYDGKRMLKNLTGLGNYSRYILSLVSKKFPENHYLVYSPAPASPKLQGEISAMPDVEIKISKASLKSIWRSFGIIKDLKKDRIDLYHGLSNELPFGIKSSKITSVVTIHDLIFLRYPEFFPKIDRLIYKLKTRFACKNADRIIAVSEHTKRDIIEFYNTPAHKIDVVYQDCGDGFKNLHTAAEKEEIRLKYNLPAKFLLSVGTIEERKNLLLTVKALKLIDHIGLVVIGKEKPYLKKVKDFIEANNLHQRVLFLKDVAYADLPAIYQIAEVFVYPSRYEGFGIPILEALYSQVPVIAATGSCLEEAGGEGSLYTNLDNFEELAHHIKNVLDKPEKRAQMIAAGNTHLQQFNDAVLANKLMDTYQKAIADAKR